MFGFMSKGKAFGIDVDDIENVIDRGANIDALSALGHSLRKPDGERKIEKAAFCLDTNAFLHIFRHKKKDDVIDFLTQAHDVPLIVAGQTIQEFWNNILTVNQAKLKVLRKNLDEVRSIANQLDGDLSDLSANLIAGVDQFDDEYDFFKDEKYLDIASSLIESLSSSSVSYYVPRLRFAGYAELRKKTKTPPGFKDDGHGDFYVWLDFLLGLKATKRNGVAFDKAVLVTNDKKKDWSLFRQPHPILYAEVWSLLGIPFEIWSLDELAEAIAK